MFYVFVCFMLSFLLTFVFYLFILQMGRGRTTTGTVIACLLKLRIDYGRPIRVLHEDVTHEELDSGSSSGEENGGNGAASTSSISKVRSEGKGRAFGIDDILLLWKITRLFDNGVKCREALDAIIDRCSALQNIRQAVLHYRKVFNQQHVEPRVRMVALSRGAEYLERYFRLIAFAAYLGSEAFDGFCGQGESRMTFKSWLRQRPEVQAMKWSIRIRPGRFLTVPVNLLLLIFIVTQVINENMLFLFLFYFFKIFFNDLKTCLHTKFAFGFAGRTESTTRIPAWRCSNGGHCQGT